MQLEIRASLHLSFTDTKPSRSSQINHCFSFVKLHQPRVETSVKLATKVSCSSTFAKLSFFSQIGNKHEISQEIGSYLLFKQNITFQMSLGMSGHRAKW